VPKLARRESIREAKTEEDIFRLLKTALTHKVTLIDEGNHGYVFIKEDRTFFCSELVAKAFKEVGIIENDERACSSFYPKHFASDCCDQDQCLKLLPGVTIDRELEIEVGEMDLQDMLKDEIVKMKD